MSQKIDLHNHTYLCNHAEGKVDDFIEKAIENKIDIYGFSDHAPMNFDQKYRMGKDEVKKYKKMVLEAKEKYKNKIEILFGYEVDFLDGYMEKDILEAKCDYLIGSVHFIDKWGFDNPEFIGNYQNQNIDIIWEKYFNSITDMVKSNLFDIVGHIDLIKVFKFIPNRPIMELVHESLKCVKENQMVIEINTAGFRKPIQEQYPSLQIIKKMYEMDIPITFGSDAHRVEEVGFNLDKCIKFAKDIGYKKAAIFRDRNMQLIKI